MKGRKKLLLALLAAMMLNSLAAAQSGDACTFAGIAQAKMLEAQKQLTVLDQTIGEIEKTSLISDQQEKKLSDALTEFADARLVAYEATLKSVEYAARTEGVKGDVGVFKRFDDFAKKTGEAGKLLLARLTRITDGLERGKIKRPPDRKAGPISEKTVNIVNTAFERPENDPSGLFYREQTTASTNQFNLLGGQNSCVNTCLSMQWGKCLSCVLSLVCSVTNSGGSGSGNGGYQSCIDGCNSQPFFKRVACKAKCIFS